MDFFELAKTRESCRSFSDKMVEPELLTKCVETARLAPSACNGQPWHFFAVSNEDKVKQIRTCVHTAGINAFAEKVPSFIVVVEEKTNISSRLGARINDNDYTQLDIGIACAHICFAASELGLSTCILGWFTEKGLKECLDIPKSKRIRLVIAVGYSDAKPIREKKRQPLAEILTQIK
ncbi:MAG: NAD(P)H nitroreductase [Clostridiales bacterium]|nr:NAD(P)H nitroreductase [Clostridiales bacterium]